ncbi:hypothetical protein [Lacticaseibacillus sharpeae]|uniref:Uncharacterized protein n=1 Tax=Lacticaseibacillus sharpeae JCM 1186 = DSM 20505 TaxID=1291052 RepID=A0A0R1ZM38_9LACO|nr:hypothetical protein [Lacticaseibacillus sharpeae]KRM55410.1 hypothetical protein FC18_GL001305 [Lacticaseibacillus sharpeae JCM 1186 = DSM 20505]
MQFLKNISIPKIAVALMVVGAVIAVLGFTMSGFSVQSYHEHPNAWYYMNN